MIYCCFLPRARKAGFACFFHENHTFHLKHEFHINSWKFINSSNLPCGNVTSAREAEKHMNYCVILRILKDTFTGMSTFSYFCFHIKSWFPPKINVWWISINYRFSVPSAPFDTMKRSSNYCCFLTLGTQRKRNYVYNHKPWIARDSPWFRRFAEMHGILIKL